MTSEEIKQAILSAEDLTITTQAIHCDFYGRRTIKEISYSALVGYTLIQDYEWTEAYNNDGIMGGYSLTNIVDSLVKDV